MQIKIKNWDKYQPRKDIKNPTWFALSNRIFEDPDLFSLTDAELRALLYIFCQASQKNSAEICLNLTHAERIGQLKKEAVFLAVEKLSDIGILEVSVRERTQPVRICTESVRDTTRQDITLHNTTEPNTSSTVAKIAPVAAANKLVEFSNEKELLEKINPEQIQRWSHLYDAVFLNRELIKAWGYYQNNPLKRPKTARGWIRALSAWFDRGWPRYVAQIKSQAPAENASNPEFWASVFGKDKTNDRA